MQGLLRPPEVPSALTGMAQPHGSSKRRWGLIPQRRQQNALATVGFASTAVRRCAGQKAEIVTAANDSDADEDWIKTARQIGSYQEPSQELLQAERYERGGTPFVAARVQE